MTYRPLLKAKTMDLSLKADARTKLDHGWDNNTMNAEPANTRFHNGRSTAPARLSWSFDA